jgi:hypothetical protein
MNQAPAQPEARRAKKCSKCKQLKVLGDFYPDSRSKTGKRPECKLCTGLMRGQKPLSGGPQGSKFARTSVLPPIPAKTPTGLSGASSKPWVKLGIAFGDIHIPFQSKKALDVLHQYVRDERFDFAVNLGDLIDNAGISRYAMGSLSQRYEAMPLPDTYDRANEFLDIHLEAFRSNNPDLIYAYIEGNHEWRTHSYGENHPEMGDLKNVPKRLKLSERGVVWVPYAENGSLFRVGRAFFGHGYTAAAAHASITVKAYNLNFFYGHTHDEQSFSLKKAGKVIAEGEGGEVGNLLWGVVHPRDGESVKAASCGCLCEYDQAYLHGKPTNWQHGFRVFQVFEDGTFQDTFVPIINNSFLGPTNGKMYSS